MKKLMAAMLTLSMIITSCPFAFAEKETEPPTDGGAVSGYVSAENGDLKLAGTDKTPTIYVDGEDYEGVIRAVGDLKDDIKTVTDVTPVITNKIETDPLMGSRGLQIGENSMYVSDWIPTEELVGADCYAAVYDRNGALTGVAKGTPDYIGNPESPELPLMVSGFKFDAVLKRPAGGTAKAFVWKDMEPMWETIYQYPSEKVILDDVDIIVGTIGESKAIDTLAACKQIDVSEIEGLWESFTIQQVDNTLIIAGSDKRGTIYGIYDLCEKMGVSPWNFWADTVVPHEDNLYINLPEGGYTEGEPSVKYRGIFLNDEFNMSEWSKSMGNTGKNMNNATYEKIFELLLRLKANYLWPAMHTYSTAFNNTDGNAELADKYGIVMGSSHCEPLLRNNLGELYNFQQEWTAAHPDKKLYINTTDDAKNNVSWMWTDKDGSGNAVDNKDFLTDYWRERAKANGGYENTYTIGMRGVHDGKFSTNMDSKTAMTEILAVQRQILTEELCGDGKEITDIPQVFIPYKEMLDLYNGGLNVPEDVTLMWPDDNFGYIRQLPTEKERERSGGAGIYYHLSYFGRPTSYLWLGTTQPGLIREEMTKAYDMGAQKIWVANVGDLKPAETEIEYFLDLARDVETVRNTDIGDWLKDRAKRDFGFNDTQAEEYADVKLKYYELANSRRPEHMVNGLYSLTDFGDEGQKVIDGYAEIENRASTLYNTLSEDRKPSFYELMLYPIKGAGNMAKKYIYSDKSKLYAEKGYGAAANKYAKLSDDAYQAVVDDTAEYTSMLGGKWAKMMNPYQTQLKGSFGGPISGKLENATVSELPYTEMEIVPEGETDLTFTKYSTEPKYIDIINTGTGSFEWTAETDADWIKINKTSGTVADNDRIYISVDAEASNVDKTATGKSVKRIYFKQKIGGTVINTKEVAVTVNAVPGVLDIPEKAYIENDGCVSIEAEHFTNSVKNGEYEWEVEKDFGRSGDSVKIYPDTAKTVATPNKENSAYLEYDVYFTSSGTFPIDVYRMPTINELSGATMRCRIGIDDGTPVQFNGNTKTTDNSTGADAWGKGVLQNTQVISGTITVPSAGYHTIRLYNESAGVVIDKFVITTGEKKASYYGAPESYNTTYNNQMKPLPEPSVAAAEQIGDITPLFEPSMIICGVTDNDTTADILKLDGADNGMFVAASYDDKGNMIDATYTDIDLSDIAQNETKTITYEMPSVEIPSKVGGYLVDVQYMIISADYEALAMPRKDTLIVNGLENDDVSLMASYDEGYIYPATRMNDYIGKESVCVISESGSTNTSGIKYIRQNTVAEDTYSKLPFNGEGKFDLKIKVAGENDMISETFSTIKNISTDTEPTSKELYNWNFDTDQTGTGNNVPVLGGNAIYDSSNKCVKLTPTAEAGGNLSIDLDGAVTAAQGEKITVVSKIAYGELSGKYMTYELTDSNGKMLVRSKINRYTGKTQTLTIGGVEQLTDGNIPSALPKIDKNATTPNGKFSIYTAVIDPASNEITLTISNTANSTVNEYRGKLPEGTSYDLKKLYFTTDYNNAGRSCYVDDVSVTKSKAASYTITFVADGELTLTDGVTGAVIEPNADGIYNLCDGIYNYTVTKDTTSISDTFELSPATESKTITIPSASAKQD